MRLQEHTGVYDTRVTLRTSYCSHRQHLPNIQTVNPNVGQVHSMDDTRSPHVLLLRYQTQFAGRAASR